MGCEATRADCCKEDFEPMATTKKSATNAESTIVGRQELTKSIATQTGLTQKKSAEVLEATLVTIRQSLSEGNEVRLVGFGSFKVRRSAARKGVNPRDRKPIEVPAKDRVRFSPGKELSDAVEKK
jgi:nucleoid DNA-binding protein